MAIAYPKNGSDINENIILKTRVVFYITDISKKKKGTLNNKIMKLLLNFRIVFIQCPISEHSLKEDIERYLVRHYVEI